MRVTQRSNVMLLDQPHWSAKFIHPLTLKDGTELVTLADALSSLARYVGAGTTCGVARGTDLAMELLVKAAETGAYADRKAAADQVATVLSWRGVY
jgi:hypothetical protein